MFGISTRTGGSKCAPEGCRVQAKGGEAPSGSGMGISSKCTWFSETTVPSGAGAPPTVIDPGWIVMVSPSRPSTVSTVGWLRL